MVYKIAHNFIKQIELPTIKFYSDGPIGYCEGQRLSLLNNNIEYIPKELGFHKDLLDGKTYSLEQIKEVIIHELSHLIANLVHKTECGHDNRFMQIVELMGGIQSEYISLTSINLELKATPEDNHAKNYSFHCSHCNKIVYETNSSGNEIFKYFLFSQDDYPLPLILNKFDDKRTSCCNAKLDFVFEYDSLKRELDKDIELSSLINLDNLLEKIK